MRRGRKRLAGGFVLLLCLLGTALPVQAGTDTQREDGTVLETEADEFIWQQMDEYDLQEIEDGFAELFPQYRLDVDLLLRRYWRGRFWMRCPFCGRDKGWRDGGIPWDEGDPDLYSCDRDYLLPVFQFC